MKNHTRKLCIHFVYKIVQDVYNWCIQNVYKMYTICIQNLYHISTNFCLNFVYKIKRTMPANFYRQNVYKSLSKCGIHFVYKSLSKCGINLVYIFLYINSDLQKVCIINIMYTISIQNSYRMYTEWTPFQHILTRLLCSS